MSSHLEVTQALKSVQSNDQINEVIDDENMKCEKDVPISLEELTQQLKDKEAQLTQSGQRIDLDFRKASAQEAREDYRAETDRVAALFNTGKDNDKPNPQVEAVIKQVLRGMMNNGELKFDDTDILDLPEGQAKRAPDGNYYIQHENGNFSRVDMY